MAPSSPSTPLMRQYHALKQQVPHALLLFHLGDFYELFYDDAVVAARELQITLTSRNKEKGQPIPMCGVPVHSADNYIQKLIQNGHRVAICDQVEDAKKAKKLVRREVTRIITPGTASDLGLLQAGKNNYLAAAAEGGARTGLAYVDISTGEFRMTEMAAVEVDAALENLGASEVLLASEGPLFASQPRQQTAAGGRLHTELEPWVFDFEHAQRALCSHFKLHSLDGLGAASHPAAVAAAGAVLYYLRDTQRAALQHLDRPTYYQHHDWMVLDAVTVRNLEMVEPLFGGPPHSTLLHVIDQTSTPMGKRLLRQWMMRPSVNQAEIESRLDGVSELHRETILRAEIEGELAGVQDMERLLAKVTLGTANPRELLGLGRSLQCLPPLRRLVGKLESPRMGDLLRRLDELSDVRDHILTTIADEPPVHLADGGTIREGVDAELDELRAIRKNSRGYIAALEARERERTGIASLKVKFNNVFGFYIEVSKANSRLAPADYDRKQTLVNAERFTTPELKDYERKVLEAEERILEKEKALFEQVRGSTAREAPRIRTAAGAVAELDLLRCLAHIAAEHHYTRPQFSSNNELRIAAGRHPVIERMAEAESGERFIANDAYLNDSSHVIAVITGPNMGGKSTYLRQVAQIHILAQMGSFVPASRADLPIVDRIFTRIGASDNLAMGRSTFMVEMTETAQILNTATPRSLVLLDEVGRGTSTFDGLAIAWAVVEDIHARTRAKTLFATHYHELTELADLLPGVFNLHVSVKEAGEQVIFLRKVEPGRADRSYGIEVARLAGLPLGVIERARAVLARHEQREHDVSEELGSRGEPKGYQPSLFHTRLEALAEELKKLNVDELRPIDALNFLSEMKTRVRKLESEEG